MVPKVAVADVVVEQQLKACDVVQSEVHVVLDNLADMQVNNNMSSNEIFDDLEVRDTAVPEQNLDGKDADIDLSPEKVLFVDSTAEFLDSVADASAGKQPQLDPSAAAVVSDSSVSVKIVVSEVMETNKGCRANSCPQTGNCTALSGPWCYEFLQDQDVQDVGVVFSPAVKSKQVAQQRNYKRSLKKKSDCLLKHSVHSLKRVARLPSKDRLTVLKLLSSNCMRRQKRQHSKKSNERASGEHVSSNISSSVNKDWQNWVTLHAQPERVAEDVCEVGKTIRLKFKGDAENMFNSLSSGSRKNKVKNGVNEGRRSEDEAA